ncbi:V-type ATP synthase subunit E [Hespellia stercorisuis]|uniref:H+-ATPase subunit E/Vma4 n=1 Tax=Hespellia stercorisuis DSM 15480 TaxID=1121950 RepID=A0A1M6K606_9FIRM|nr:V-type ATP synthase subunit E [Hespellia stercorisuis]SHJ54363.1 H+-ATPase subunit E/Vma4 [Hespellia stercorisuis DSM 15480]
MTLEEKIEHLQASSMEEARAESNAIIDAHREALEKLFEDHKEEALRQAETRIKAETVNAKQQLNKAMSKSQIELKRQQGQIQQDLKDQLFDEVRAKTVEFMKTEAYDDLLVAWIKDALSFAGGEAITIYINPSDERKQSDLRDATGVSIMISREDFMGGIRAVLRGRNILIDHSFKTSIENEYAKFIFMGGDGRA